MRSCLLLLRRAESLPGPDSCRVLRAGGRVRGRAKRPRSGAVGALDASTRERIIVGGRAGSLMGGGSAVRGGGLSVRVTFRRDGRGARPGAASLTLARGAWAAPVT